VLEGGPRTLSKVKISGGGRCNGELVRRGVDFCLSAHLCSNLHIHLKSTP
jgi:hypothetical protein